MAVADPAEGGGHPRRRGRMARGRRPRDRSDRSGMRTNVERIIVSKNTDVR